MASVEPEVGVAVPAKVQMHLDILEGLFDGVLLVGPDGRIRFWNRGAERITGFRASEVLGLPCCEVVRHHDFRGTPRCPQAVCPVLFPAAREEGLREALVYIQHRRGMRIPVISRTRPMIGPDGYAGVIEIFSDNRLGMVRRKHLHELRRLALLDPLTGLGNRRYGEAMLSVRLQERETRGGHFGVLLADLDYFKRINDQHGHGAGDQVLRTIGKVFAAGLRSADAAVRWGGEEFLFLLSDLDRDALGVVAEKLRTEVERTVIRWGDHDLRITVSLGGCLALDGDTWERVLERSDRGLYTSKREGRNRVTLDAPSRPR